MINIEDTKEIFTGDGSATLFAFDFKVNASSDLRIVKTSTQGVETTLTLGVHYSVALNANQNTNPGGTVTYPIGASSVLAIGETITVIRAAPFVQPSTFTLGVQPSTIEAKFDTLTMFVQQLYERAKRTLTIAVSDADATLDLGTVEQRASKIPTFDAAGNVELVASIIPGSFNQTLFNAFLSTIGDAARAAFFSAIDVAGAVAQEFYKIVNPRSSQEIAAAVTPSNYRYPSGYIRRYGAVLDGVADDTAALQRWADVGGALYYDVPGNARITASITLKSNTTIYAIPDAQITLSVANTHCLLVPSGRSHVNILGGKYVQTAIGSLAVGMLTFDSASHCRVEGVEISGQQWAGIFLNNTNNCVIDSNLIGLAQANAAGDKADIVVYRNSASNIISRNKCFGGLEADVGIMVQDPGVGALSPRWNKVVDNLVGDHRTYGIIFYMGNATQQGDNECSGNTIQNITGTGNAGNSGSGIYCVGNGLGAQIIANNNVRNCCISTTGTSNGPGGISVNDSALTGKKVVVVGNSVEEQIQGHGILLSTLRAGVTCVGNTVKIPSTNNGTGAGGAALLGNGIRITESNAVTVGSNSVEQSGTGDAFFGFNTAASSLMITVTGNTFRAAGPGHALRFDRLSSFTHTDVVISGNHLRNDGAGNLMMLNAIERCSVTANIGGANTGVAIAITDCTFVQMAGNSISTNNAVGISTAGTCTGSKYDIANRAPGTITNGATGFRFEFLGGVPGTGTFVAGDTVWFTAPAAGAAPGAVCTTGGSPGTWKNMAALAA